MEAECSSETSVSTYKSTRRHDPKEQQRHLRCRDNFKSQVSDRAPGQTEWLVRNAERVCDDWGQGYGTPRGPVIDEYEAMVK
jgi:hypothetical protein